MINLEACPCSGRTLSKLIQPGILAVLAGGPMHGYRIVERLAELRITGGRRPDVAGVYRALRAMKGRGLVTARWDVSDPGPAKHLYRMTQAGRACLGRWVDTLRGYREAVDELLGVVESASREREPHTRPRSARRGSRS